MPRAKGRSSRAGSSRRRNPGGRRGLRDSERRRRTAAASGLALLLLGLIAMVGGIAANSASRIEPIKVDPDGTTTLPHTWFFQNSWALFANIDDPRRPPSAAELGCSAGGFRLPRQPKDMTAYGSRVVDGDSLSAVLIVGHTSADDTLRCSGASDSAPLLLASSSAAPPFTPTGITLLGVLMLAAAALVHPAAGELPARILRRGRD